MSTNKVIIRFFILVFVITINIKALSAQTPIIYSFTTSGNCTSPNVTVTINGNNFFGATAVTVGNNAVTSFQVISNNNITAIVPVNSFGVIKVITPFGIVNSTDSFYSNKSYTAYAYIPNQGSNSVAVINTVKNTVVDSIPVKASQLSASPDGTKVYVADFLSNTVSVISADSNKVMATLTVNSPVGIRFSPDGTKVFVSSTRNNLISVINTATNTITASVNVGANPEYISVSPDGTRLYVSTGIGRNTITVVNTVSNTVVATFPCNDNWGSVVSPDGTTLYVTNVNHNTVSVYSTVNDTLLSTISVGANPEFMSISPDGIMLYVTNSVGNTVSIISTATNAVVATDTVGTAPEGISITPDGSCIYVINTGSNTVSVISTVTNQVLATIPFVNISAGIGNFIANLPTECNQSSTNMPLVLLDFTVELMSANSICNWQTNNENNTRQFIVERSIDGLNYNSIGFINAIGNTVKDNQYKYMDTNIVNQFNISTLYYRLKMLDKDGHFTYSKIVSLTINAKNGFSIYPNPAYNFVSVETPFFLNNGELLITDMSGKLLKKQKMTSKKTVVDLAAISTHFCLITIKSDECIKTEKLIIR